MTDDRPRRRHRDPASRSRPALCPSTCPPTACPPVVESERGLDEARPRIAGGEGPVAIDAERASGYRYGQRAYLVQLRREGAGTWLIDPIACPDLAPVDRRHRQRRVDPARRDPGPRLPRRGGPAAASAVRHRARRPAARAAPGRAGRRRRALPRAVAGQGALRGRLVDAAAARAVAAVRRPRRRGARRAAQPHGRRPRPAGQGRWARQEFEALLAFTGPAPRVDPWRRTSGMHRVRHRRTAAVVRELW